MNRARVAQLLRELADEIEAEVPEAERSAPRPRRDRKPRALTRPAGEATPEVKAMANKILRERGFR